MGKRAVMYVRVPPSLLVCVCVCVCVCARARDCACSLEYSLHTQGHIDGIPIAEIVWYQGIDQSFTSPDFLIVNNLEESRVGGGNSNSADLSWVEIPLHIGYR